MNKIINTLCIAITGLLAHLAFAADAAALVDQREYARPHQLVDVGGGRRMNLFCLGSGSPTVVFDAGSGIAGWDWFKVHPEVAKKTRACVYDRAGLGFSDPSPRPITSANAVQDLHALLSAAGIAPPFVLVGHSYAGRNVRLYAHTYSKEVSGIVIVDGGSEDETERLDRITKGKYSKLMAILEAKTKDCAVAARAGFSTSMPVFSECVADTPPAYGAALSAALVASRMSPQYWEVMAAEDANAALAVDGDQWLAARKPFGDLPLIYLTRGVSPFLVPGRPQSDMNKAVERDNKAMHDEIASLSTRGSNRVISGAGHFIHIDKPGAVIEAIFEVLSQSSDPSTSP